MNWFLLNIPLAVMIFLAITGIPVWLVIRHPDHRPALATAAGRNAAAGQAACTAAQADDLAVIRDERELVGASAIG